MRSDESRSSARITRSVLDRLSELAAEDREDLISRMPRWEIYRDRVICTALCQGAALHYVDGRNGVKDLDVYTFYSAHEGGPFPYRRHAQARFDRAPFDGHWIDPLGRSLPEPEGVDPRDAIYRYLSRPTTKTARLLAQKAVVLIDPEPLRGEVAWPLGGSA